MSTASGSKIGRRAVLAGLSMVGASPILAQTLPTNPDVVIVGAGAAGLQAARTLAKSGISFVIVEAADRVGKHITGSFVQSPMGNKIRVGGLRGKRTQPEEH